MVGPPHCAEHVGPAILGIAKHRGDKILGLRGLCIVRRRRAALLDHRAAAGKNFRAVDEDARIDAERPADQAENEDRADAEAVRATGHGEAAVARAAIVLDIAGATEFIPTHAFAPSKAGARAPKTLSICRPLPSN